MALSPYILVIEDDHLQEGPLVDQIKDAFPNSRVKSIYTEHEFREQLTELHSEAPDLVIMDVMLRWADPRPGNTDPPEEVVREGFYRAGLRCAELIATDDKLRTVPVILYTILEKADLEREGKPLPNNTIYVRKSTDLHVLLRKMRELAQCA
jgi:CheY-like chemotaxis protein